MPIHGECPDCGRKFQAPDKLSGKRVKCPNCSAVIHLGGARQQATVEQGPSRREASQGPGPPTRPGVEKAQWYVQTAAGEQLGPIGKARLDGLVADGRVDGFCRVRREGWQDWKWAEAVYPQFALPVDPETQPASTPPKVSAQPTAAKTEPRLRTCPDCEKMVSTRASRCPNCGSPLDTPDDQAAEAEAAGQPAGETPSAVESAQGGSAGTRRPMRLLVTGAVSAVFLIVVVAAVVAWQLWSRSHRALDDAFQSLAAELPPAKTAQGNRSRGETTRKAATPEEIEQCVQEAAAAMAKQVDDLSRKVHLAKSLLERTEVSADLLRSLAEGDLDHLPEAKPAPAAKGEDGSYQSQYKPLFEECLAYIRQNLPAGELDPAKVQDLANRWAEGKRTALEAQMEEQLQKQLGL